MTTWTTIADVTRRTGAVIALIVCARALALAQTGASQLVIAGQVAKPITVTVQELRTFPRTTVDVKAEGRALRYEGVLVSELLRRAGAPLGTEMRGDALISYVVATATDGYRAVFSLAELDAALTSNDVIVADTLDGKPLLEGQGPLRLVAPKDLRPSRSVRMLERLEVVRLAK